MYPTMFDAVVLTVEMAKAELKRECQQKEPSLICCRINSKPHLKMDAKISHSLIKNMSYCIS